MPRAVDWIYDRFMNFFILNQIARCLTFHIQILGYPAYAYLPNSVSTLNEIQNNFGQNELYLLTKRYYLNFVIGFQFNEPIIVYKIRFIVF